MVAMVALHTITIYHLEIKRYGYDNQTFAIAICKDKQVYLATYVNQVAP